MEMILLGFVSAASLVIMILLFFLGVFVVRSQERTRAMIAQLVQILLEEDAPQPASQPSLRPKTWDEKYEQELEAAQRRLREVSGLTDPSR